jgi:hypothetical protein
MQKAPKGLNSHDAASDREPDSTFAQRARKQVGRAAGRTGSRDTGFNGGPQGLDHFSKTTDIARNMVTRFGMHEKLGLATYRRRGGLSSARTRLAHFAEWGFNLASRRLPPMRLRDRFRGGHPYAKASMHFQK